MPQDLPDGQDNLLAASVHNSSKCPSDCASAQPSVLNPQGSVPQDLPDGQYSHLEKSGKKAKATPINPIRELGAKLVNYRMYGLA